MEDQGHRLRNFALALVMVLAGDICDITSIDPDKPAYPWSTLLLNRIFILHRSILFLFRTILLEPFSFQLSYIQNCLTHLLVYTDENTC